jgi:hypothetical protein
MREFRKVYHARAYRMKDENGDVLLGIYKAFLTFGNIL